MVQKWRVELNAIGTFNDYISGVSSGEIVAGDLVKSAVARHVADLERVGDEDFPYQFDERIAANAIALFPAAFRHTIGDYFKKPFILAPWQAFIVGSIFGWRTLDGRRRFLRVYVSIARKNGKSTLAAAIAIILALFDNEPAAQVFIGATRAEQARLIYNEAVRMVKQSPDLQKAADVRVPQINFPINDSFIRPLGSDKAFDGLNPHGIIFDELHAWKEQHRPFYDTLTTGSASRSQPLRFTITTAGDANSILWKEENEHAKNVVENRFAEESYFVFVATIDSDDDPFDENVWPKSIPNLGVSVDIDEVRRQANEAKSSPMAKNRFVRYFANAEVSSAEQAVDIDDWDKCRGELSDWNHADAIAAGVDSGGLNDLGAWAAVARFHDGEDDEGKPVYRYEVRQWSYIDTDTDRDLTKQPFAGWISTGKIERVPYVTRQLRDDLHDLFPDMGGRDIGFDPWNTQQMAEELQAAGFNCVKIQQTRYNLHEPLVLFLSLIEKGRIRHDGDPVLRWAVGNLVINADNQDRWLPDRKNSADKIDPAVAAIMGLRLASLAKPRPTGSFYLT